MTILLILLGGVAIFVLVFIIYFSWQAWQAEVLDSIVSVPDDDPDMVGAMQKAKETLPDFVEILQTPNTGERFLLLKARFVDGVDIEHMWVADLVEDGDGFRGVVADEPKVVKTVTFKQPVKITRDQITDWMVIQDGKVKGALTTRVLLTKMTPKQKKAFLRSMPFAFE
jgi:uncharacterized protein YegJ (DUF2314 family)